MALIAHYKLDGNADDSCGNHLGSIAGSNYSWTNGKIGQCMDITGPYTRVDTDLKLGTAEGKPFSVSCWFYKHSETTWPSIAVWGERASPGMMLYRNDGWTSRRLAFYVQYTNTSDSASSHLMYFGDLPEDEWMHIVCTMDGPRRQIYLNGVNIYDYTISDWKEYTPGGREMALGSSGAWTNSWDMNTGMLDDFQIYDHVLSQKEVKDLYKAKTNHYQLNGDATDCSGQGNHGTEVSVTYSEEPKVGNSCYTNNGSTSYINCGNQPHVTKNQTIMMWLYPTSDSARRNPWNKAYGGEGTITQETDMELNYYWGTNGGNSSPYQGFGSSQAIPLNEWSHIAVVRDLDNNLLSWYINGERTATATPSYSESATTTADLLIGDGYTSPYHGKIDDVRQYASALTQEDIRSVIKTRMSLDDHGNITTPFIEETRLRPLILDYTTWFVPDNGPVSGTVWGDYSYDVCNKRVYSTDPWGKETVVWETSGPSGDTYATNGGIYCSSQAVDINYMYRVSFWEKRVTNADATYGRYYLGCNGYGSTDGVYNRSDGGNNTNPYFWSANHTSLPIGEWFLIVGHVWPVGSGTGSNHPESGRYHIGADGKYSYYSDIGTDFVFREETTSFRPRTLAVYHGSDDNIIHHTVYPRMDKCDGTEPSIAELLSGLDSRNIDLLRNKGGDVGHPLIIESVGTTFGELNETGPVDGLTGWWPFKGSAKDMSGNGNVVTIYGATYTTDGLYLDGDDDYISVPYTTLNGLSDLTVSFWAKGTNETGTYIISISDGSNHNALLMHSPSDDVWHHLVWRRLDGVAHTYKDGVLDDTYKYNDPANPLVVADGGLIIGQEQDAFGGGFDVNQAFRGDLTDLRMYDRGISDEELGILYEQGIKTGMKLSSTGEHYITGQYSEVD